MTRHRLIAAALVTAAVMPAAGCVDFDLEERIEDTRVLAVRHEPAEIMFSPLYLLPANQRPPFPLPTTTVQTEVFAYDPRGGRVSVTTQLCPEGSDSSCRLYDKDFDTDFARLVEPAKSEVAALLEPQTIEVDVDDGSAAGRIGTTLSTDITPGVIDFFQPKNADGENVPSIFPLLPRFAVEVENKTQRTDGAEVFKERAFKRLPLALDLADPALGPDFTRSLADGLGVTICDGPVPGPDVVADADFEGEAECLHPRGANVNPGLLGFRLEATDVEDDLPQGYVEGEPDLGLQSLLRVSPGGRVAITPVWAPGSAERYQIISFDIETSELIVVNRVEDLACTWYSTRGNLSGTLTSLQFNDERLGVVWQLPTDAVSGERDSLVLVVLDQRGGTSVAELHVVYR
jgi:hypothetical protein